jgi:peroxiredoxin
MLKVGDIAPEIDAVTSDGSSFVLSQETGLCTIVYFYPKAFTPGCTAEAEHFRDNRAELMLAGARIVGISADDVQTQCRFADRIQTRFPLIADPDKVLTRAYGVKWPILGLARRVTFVIGAGRRIEAVFRHQTIVPFKPSDPMTFVDEILAFVHGMQAASGRNTGSS